MKQNYNIKSVEGIPAVMDAIQKEMLWNKACDNNKRLDRLEEKIDRILELLGDVNGRK